MRDTSVVRGGQSIGDLYGKIQQFARALHGTDGRTVHVLHDQIIRPDVVE